MVLFIASCTYQADEIGLDLQPADEKMLVLKTDTISIVAYTILEDSIRTDDLRTGVLGSFYDPVVGITTASLYSELRLSAVHLNFGIGAVIDSAFLTLAYSGLYGDSASALTFSVFELSENIHIDSTYFSNQTVGVFDDNLLGQYTFVPNVEDSVIVGTVRRAPHLRIPLNNNLSQRLLQGPGDRFQTNDKFREFFKGLYITASPASASGQGALISFDMISPLTGLTIHFRNESEDSLKYDFIINAATARFNNYNHHGFSQADPLFRQQVIDGDTMLGQQKIYLKPLSGTIARIRFPFLTRFAEQGNIVVNEARLVLPEFDDDSDLSVPQRIVVAKGLDNQGKYTVIVDQLEPLGDRYFGGFFDNETDEYSLRITRYIQQRILNPATPDYGLYLLIPGASFNSQRLILNGPDHGTKPIQLIVTYTIAN